LTITFLLYVSFTYFRPPWPLDIEYSRWCAEPDLWAEPDLDGLPPEPDGEPLPVDFDLDPEPELGFADKVR
jgi:hypothetical protein